MHLIHYKLAGGDIPTTLPSALLSSVKLGAGSTAPPLPLNIPEIILPDITISVSVPPVPMIDSSPVNPYPTSELADKFGVAEVIMNFYDPNYDIQKSQTEISNSTVAQQVLEKLEHETKTFNLKLESLGVLHRGLQDKSVSLSNSQLQLAESQRQQIYSLFQDNSNQLEQLEQELKQQYQDLVSLKSNLDNYSSMAVGDVNSLRLLRTQLSQEQNDLNSQSEMIREEKNRALAEIERTRKETERINEEPIIGNIPFNSGIPPIIHTSGLGLTPGVLFPVTQGQGAEQQEYFIDGLEVKARRKSRNIDNTLKKAQNLPSGDKTKERKDKDNKKGKKKNDHCKVIYQ